MSAKLGALPLARRDRCDGVGWPGRRCDLSAACRRSASVVGPPERNGRISSCLTSSPSLPKEVRQEMGQEVRLGSMSAHRRIADEARIAALGLRPTLPRLELRRSNRSSRPTTSCRRGSRCIAHGRDHGCGRFLNRLLHLLLSTERRAMACPFRTHRSQRRDLL